jgi:hypothetical protein
LPAQRIELVLVAKVGKKEMPVKTEDSVHLVQKARQQPIAVGGFEVDDNIKSIIFKREFFRLGTGKGEIGHRIMAIAEFDGFIGLVDTREGARQVTRHQECRTSSAATAHLQDILSFQVHGAGDMIIELDAIAVLFYGAVQGKLSFIRVRAGKAEIPEAQVVIFFRPSGQVFVQTPVQSISGLVRQQTGSPVGYRPEETDPPFSLNPPVS